MPGARCRSTSIKAQSRSSLSLPSGSAEPAPKLVYTAPYVALKRISKQPYTTLEWDIKEIGSDPTADLRIRLT